jgi:hypothetical protein
MSMSKQDFIALADVIREANLLNADTFYSDSIALLASFCQQQNSAFKRDRWLAYIAGECGPNGGKL